MKALVTGSAGFVGSRMIPALKAAGYDGIISIDIKDGHDARDFFRGHHHESETRFDLVVHLAAVVGGRALIEGNPLAVAVDLSIDSEMWQWAVRTGQPRILYFSSSAAYPISLQERLDIVVNGQRETGHYELAESDIDLDAIEHPDQTYGLAKLVGEIQAREARKHGVKVTVARPFSGTGPTQSLDYPVPAIIQRAVMLENPIEIWSDTVRDIIHIDDVIDIAIHAVKFGIEEPFNCGTGRATSFSELAEIAARAMGYEADVRVLTDKPAGVAYRVADPSFMESFYPHPLRTVEEIVAEMVEHAAVPAAARA